MANELHHRAVSGHYTPRKPTVTKAGEFCCHLIPYYKQRGIAGLPLARLLRNY